MREAGTDVKPTYQARFPAGRPILVAEPGSPGPPFLPIILPEARETTMTFGKGHHLHLIDGSAYIFRAYHALPPLTRKSDGLPVGAVAGFCNILWN